MSGEENVRTPAYKRVLAILGIVLLVGMYLVLLYEAVTGSPDTFNVFIGCAAATVAVPIVLWLLIWTIGAITGKDTIASPRHGMNDKESQRNVSKRSGDND
ncbi:MAG: hypothetical protein K6E91_06075 [Butyrivibrio sp.]|nr:hypothetical protein [Butyrivibrio sp.]